MWEDDKHHGSAPKEVHASIMEPLFSCFLPRFWLFLSRGSDCKSSQCQCVHDWIQSISWRVHKRWKHCKCRRQIKAMFSQSVSWNSEQFQCDDGNFGFFWCAFRTTGQGQAGSKSVTDYAKASDECALFQFISLCGESNDFDIQACSAEIFSEWYKWKRQKREKTTQAKGYLPLSSPVHTEACARAHTHTHTYAHTLSIKVKNIWFLRSPSLVGVISKKDSLLLPHLLKMF